MRVPQAAGRRLLPILTALALVVAAAGPALADPPTPPSPPTSTPPPAQPDTPSGGDLMDAIMPGDQAGPYATSRYVIYFDDGSRPLGLLGTGAAILGGPVTAPLAPAAGKLRTPPSPAAVVLGLLTDVTFAIARWLVGVALWIIRWAYSFPVAQALANPAGAMSTLYNARLIGPLGLIHFVLTLAAAYAGWQTLRGRLAHGAGEFGVSLLVYAAALVALASPVGGFTRAMDGVKDISASVLSLAMENNPAAPPPACPGVNGDQAPAFQPLACRLHLALIQQPADLLNWGAVLPPGSPCAARRDTVLDQGLGARDPKVRDIMSGGGCQRYADFNADPTADRLVGAFLMVLAALLIVLALIALAGTVVIAQLVAVALLSVAWPAFTVGLLPGGGRHLFWRWVTAMVAAFAAVVVMSGFLSFLVWTTAALLQVTQGSSVLARFGLLDAVAVVLFVLRKRINQASKRAIRGWGSRLEHARVGGSHGASWLAPALAGAGAGIGLEQGLHRMYRAQRLFYQAQFVADHLPGRSHRGGRGGPRSPGAAGPPTRGPAALDRSGRAAAARRLGKAAWDLTGGLPHAAPRAAARASVEASARVQGVRDRLGAVRRYSQEWRDGLRYPAQVFGAERARLLRERQQATRPAPHPTSGRRPARTGPRR